MAYLGDISEEQVTDISGYYEDQQLSANHRNTTENTEENTGGTDEIQSQEVLSHKRASSLSAPVSTSKKARKVDILAEKLDMMTAAMTRPLEIVDQDKQAIHDAVACWTREFKSESSDIKLAFMEEWREDPGKAFQFTLLEPCDRQHLVRKKFPLTAKEDDNTQENDSSASQRYSDDAFDLVDDFDRC